MPGYYYCLHFILDMMECHKILNILIFVLRGFFWWGGGGLLLEGILQLKIIISWAYSLIH